MSQRKSDYLYDLPEELIAQRPAERRDASRLLVLDRESGAVAHERFPALADHLRPGDLLVANEAMVIPARLQGRRPTGGRVELMLLRLRADGAWECLARPGKRLREGSEVELAEGWRARVREELEEGKRIVRFEGPAGGDFDAFLARHGAMPLPPYIRREADDEDRERYQTVYARRPGAVAAPTAGLHFTPELLARLDAQGVGFTSLTLDVSLGTFRPVAEEDVTRHVMHAERYEIPEAAARAIERTKAEGGRVIAVGTTVVRSLEASARESGRVAAGAAETDIFIRPPFSFRVVDGLVTNFHLPGSTLIMLVAAFAGRQRTLEAYREAVEKRYRFFSYGDAMLIL